MRRPVDPPYVISTQFGVPDSNALFGYHSGVDYAVPTGRQIYAPVSGTLTNVVSPTGGNMVVIFDGQFYHRLMHNSSFSRGNGPVTEGNEVARAGTTGLSTGPHCHWDINVNGQTARSFADFRDPARWLNGEYLNQGGTMPGITPTPKQIDETINLLNLVGYNQPASDALFGMLRPEFNNNFFETTIQVLKNILADPNRPKPGATPTPGPAASPELAALDMALKAYIKSS